MCPAMPGFQQDLDEPELQAEFFDLIHMLHMAFLLFLGCKGVGQGAAVPYLKVCPPTVAEFSVKWLRYAISVFDTSRCHAFSGANIENDLVLIRHTVNTQGTQVAFSTNWKLI